MKLDEITIESVKAAYLKTGLKPKRGSLGNYHILWDATWTQDPPHDPILLKHLGRYVYAVLAAWDLTPLERALLR